MKDSQLLILLVDDNPDDRALVMRELRREFTNLQVEQITDQKSFQRALDQEKPDLVITDFQLRWTDGLIVLNTIKSRWPECPVVMFTGTGSEEIAVAAMKAGLDDYVLKSPKHYARLPAAARLALKMARQRLELKEAETRYSQLFSTVPVGLFRAKPNGEFREVNPALIEMLGYPDRESLLKVNAQELFVQGRAYESFHHAIEHEGVLHRFETQLRTHDGRICWAEIHARAVRDPASNQVYYEGSLEDITERKQAEEEREKLISELQEALAKIKTLSGLLPICSSCKKIRDDKGYWNQIEVYIESHSDAEFTHSFCPDCMRRLYPEISEELAK